MGTDKEMLAKGLKTMAGSLIFIFLGPVILFSAFNNREHPLYIPVLILGIAAMGVAIYLGFRGIRIIMKSMFG